MAAFAEKLAAGTKESPGRAGASRSLWKKHPRGKSKATQRYPRREVAQGTKQGELKNRRTSAEGLRVRPLHFQV
jgi:hypothetical protein